MKIFEIIKRLYEQLSGKTKRYLMLIGAVAIVLQALNIIGSGEDALLSAEDLKLPEYGQEDATIPVSVHVGADSTQDESIVGLEKFDTVIGLTAKQYDVEQAERFFEVVKKQLPNIILASNSSLEDVHSKLALVESIDGIPVDIAWYSSDYNIIDSQGNVNNSNFEKNETVGVTLFALLSCGEHSCEYLIDLTVVCRQLSEQEEMMAGINKAITTAINSSSGDYVNLPESYNGRTLTYHKKTAKPGNEFLLLGIMAMVAVLIGDVKQRQFIAEKRNQQLRFDYSEIVSKITLLVGAGMTMRCAWERIVADYKMQELYENNGIIRETRKRYVYDEMAESCNQIRAGIPEAEVYEQFGKRCGVKEYQKLSTLIVQNLKKGTKDLMTLLELETIEAFENRKNLAKVKGEEAGTKLLLPMVLLLVIVMIMVLVPAMLSFEM